MAACTKRLARARPGLLGTLVAAALLGVGTVDAQDQSPADDPWGFDDLDASDPTMLELARDQALDMGLFTAFAVLAMISFLRKSVALKYLTLVVSVAYMGIYKSQLISITNIFSTLTANLPIFSYSMAWYLFAGFTVVTTVFWGRLYCGRICAFGALTQLLDAIVPDRFRVDVPKSLEKRAGYVKYLILFGAVGYYLITREIGFYRYIEPFWMFTFEASTLLWVLLGVLLIASIFIRNLYCRFFCPVGAALGLISTLTLFKIKRWSECDTCQLCEKVCEWGAIRNRQIIMTECVRCDDCERLYADQQHCPHWLLEAKRRARRQQTGMQQARR